MPKRDNSPPPLTERLLRRADVVTKVGVCFMTIYRYMESQGFPKPIKIGVKAVRWKESEVDHWIETRKTAS